MRSIWPIRRYFHSSLSAEIVSYKIGERYVSFPLHYPAPQNPGHGWSKLSQKDSAIWSVGIPITPWARAGGHRGLHGKRPWINAAFQKKEGQASKETTYRGSCGWILAKAGLSLATKRLKIIKCKIYIAHLHSVHGKLPCIRKIMTDAKWAECYRSVSGDWARSASSQTEPNKATPCRAGGTRKEVDPEASGPAVKLTETRKLNLWQWAGRWWWWVRNGMQVL